MINRNELSKKAILKCPDDYKLEFPNSKCSVTISVGQEPHERDKFKSTLAVVNDSFNHCTIMVCDSLQRHTLKIGMQTTDDEIHKHANQLGESWIGRNINAIKKLDIEYNIIRWDYWLSHPEYKKSRKIIDDLALHNQGFVNVIEETAMEFLKRNLHKITNIESEQNVLRYSREYLKEECAVMLLWMKDNYQFEIYPSKRNTAMDFVYKHVISKINPNLVRAVAIKFKSITPVMV